VSDFLVAMLDIYLPQEENDDHSTEDNARVIYVMMNATMYGCASAGKAINGAGI